MSLFSRLYAAGFEATAAGASTTGSRVIWRDGLSVRTPLKLGCRI